jgi:hypothetical protein
VFLLWLARAVREQIGLSYSEHCGAHVEHAGAVIILSEKLSQKKCTRLGRQLARFIGLLDAVGKVAE